MRDADVPFFQLFATAGDDPEKLAARRKEWEELFDA
jgi:hypothetical protein